MYRWKPISKHVISGAMMLPKIMDITVNIKLFSTWKPHIYKGFISVPRRVRISTSIRWRAKYGTAYICFMVKLLDFCNNYLYTYAIKESGDVRNRSLITSLLVLVSCFFIFAVPSNAASNKTINVLLNGKVVTFTKSTGYPYVDKNNRTMVPLRVTMESAGFVVGYDTNAHTAIVITENNRIEVPIGTNKIYTNNQLTENDTIAVVKNGRTYLPIRAVLENAGYTVEWASNTKTVNAYNFDYNSNELVPYSTSDLSALLDNVIEGDVVYINGQYYATPDYVKMITNVQVHYYSNDLNTAIYPEENRYDLAKFDESQIEWISGITFDHALVENSKLNELGLSGEQSNIPEYSFIYAFHDDSNYTTIIYYVSDMTDEFMAAENATGTFSGIRMKKESGTLYFYYADLKKYNIYPRE